MAIAQWKLAEAAKIELRRRQAEKSRVENNIKAMVAELSERQRDYVLSNAPRKRLLGARQSGKSHDIAVDVILTGFEARCDSMYIAPTSKAARNAVWSKLDYLND